LLSLSRYRGERQERRATTVTMSNQLPTLDSSILSRIIQRLLECNPKPLERLTRQVSHQISTGCSKPKTYQDLIQLLRSQVDSSTGDGHRWSSEDKAELVGGHPRIGAPLNQAPVTSNGGKDAEGLSEESRKEQLRGGQVDSETIQSELKL